MGVMVMRRRVGLDKRLVQLVHIGTRDIRTSVPASGAAAVVDKSMLAFELGKLGENGGCRLMALSVNKAFAPFSSQRTRIYTSQYDRHGLLIVVLRIYELMR